MILNRFIVCSLALLAVIACTTTQDGAIEGTVTPSNATARITVLRDNAAVASQDIGGQDGKFRITLAPGTYTLHVIASVSPYPLSFSDVLVEPGKTTTLPPINLASTGKTVISGTIAPPGQETKVMLLSEGKERAAISTYSDGSYTFTELPAGRYTLQVSSPGYAGDSVALQVGDNQNITQNLRLLYITNVRGVDWSSGTIRATGIGLPPRQSVNSTVRREMAKRAAVVDAERMLVKIIAQIKISPDQTLKSFQGEKYTETIRGFVRGQKTIREQERKDGSFEVELELPLTGPGGLSSVVRQ